MSLVNQELTAAGSTDVVGGGQLGTRDGLPHITVQFVGTTFSVTLQARVPNPDVDDNWSTIGSFTQASTPLLFTFNMNVGVQYRVTWVSGSVRVLMTG